MTSKHYSMVIILAAGATLTLIRRWKNTDPEAGMYIAGWTLFAIILCACVEIGE